MASSLDVVRLFRRALRCASTIEDAPCRRKTIRNIRVAFRLHQGAEYTKQRQTLFTGGRAVVDVLEGITTMAPETRSLLFRKKPQT